MIKILITHFGILQTIVLDNGSAFIRANLLEFITRYRIYWVFSSNYYLQGKRLDELNNKNLTFYH